MKPSLLWKHILHLKVKLGTLDKDSTPS